MQIIVELEMSFDRDTAVLIKIKREKINRSFKLRIERVKRSIEFREPVRISILSICFAIGRTAPLSHPFDGKNESK